MTDNDQDIDARLYRDARAGDARAFARLYERYKKRVFGFVRTYLPRAQDAEDAFHDVFVIVLTSREVTFPGPHGGGFESWLFTVARHVCLNKVRRLARERASAERASLALHGGVAVGDVRGGAPATDVPSVIDNARESELDDALCGLRPAERTLVRLKLDGETTRQISARLSIPEGTVKSRMNSVVRKLREVLAYGK